MVHSIEGVPCSVRGLETRSEKLILWESGWYNVKQPFRVCSTREILTPAQCLQLSPLSNSSLLNTLRGW